MKGPIARATVRTSVVLAVRLLAQAGTLLLVARFLGPERFGAFAGVAALAVLLGSLATFGTHIVLLRELSRSHERRESALAAALGTTATCGIALLCLYLAIVWLALRPPGIGMDTVLLIGLAELLLQQLLVVASVEQQAIGNVARSQLQSNIPLLLRLVVAVAVWASPTAEPLRTYAWGYFGASVFALLLSRYSFGTRWPAVTTWRIGRREEWRDASGFAVLNLTALGPTEVDKVLALYVLPLSFAGVYSAAARVVGAAVLPVVAVLLAAMPRLFREGSHVHDSRLPRWIFGVTAAYGLAVACVLWFAAPILEFLFGTKYDGLAEILRYLTIAVPAIAMRFAVGGVVMTRRSPWARAGIEILGLLVLVAAAPLAVRHDPMSGMPMALAFAEWTMAIVGSVIAVGVLSNKPHLKEET